MKRAIAGVLASAGGFVAGFLGPSLLFMLIAYAARAPAADARASAADNYLIMLYLLGVYALLGAVAYVTITAMLHHWRRRPVRQVAAISALAGVSALVLDWPGLSMFAMLPLARALPPVATLYLSIALPGMLAGLAVLLWSSTRSRR